MTIRFKLLMLAIAAVLVVNSLLSLAGVQYVGRIWLNEIQRRVRMDLNSAAAAYDDYIDRIETFLRARRSTRPSRKRSTVETSSRRSRLWTRCTSRPAWIL